jgi:glycopeptide antibiotics resistance protein
MEIILRIFSEPGIFPLFILLFVIITGIIFVFTSARVKRFYSIICLCVWGFGLLYVTCLSRIPVWETRINLVPFQKDDNTSILDLIANIIMFVPFPMLLYGLLQKKIKFSVLSAVGIGLSIIIELLQLITHRGICDVDDLILNSAGAMIGALLTVVLMKAEKKQD